MKFIFSLFAAFVLLAISCTKTGSGGKPKISIQSINTIVPYNGELDAILKFTNSKGGLSNGTLTAIIVELNQLPPTNLLTDTIPSTIPSFPNNATGQFEFTLPSNSFQEYANQNDTFQIKFFATDGAGATSDTVTSPVIVALYQ